MEGFGHNMTIVGVILDSTSIKNKHLDPSWSIFTLCSEMLYWCYLTTNQETLWKGHVRLFLFLWPFCKLRPLHQKDSVLSQGLVFVKGYLKRKHIWVLGIYVYAMHVEYSYCSHVYASIHANGACTLSSCILMYPVHSECIGACMVLNPSCQLRSLT